MILVFAYFQKIWDTYYKISRRNNLQNVPHAPFWVPLIIDKQCEYQELHKWNQRIVICDSEFLNHLDTTALTAADAEYPSSHKQRSECHWVRRWCVLILKFLKFHLREARSKWFICLVTPPGSPRSRSISVVTEEYPGTMQWIFPTVSTASEAVFNIGTRKVSPMVSI